MKSSVFEAQKRYTESNLRKGMARINVWIPEEHAQTLKDIAQKMRTGQYEQTTRRS